MGQVGHRVIIAERDPVFGLSLTRFSRHVYKFINFTARSKADYVEALVKIWHKHNIDWFIPIRLVVTRYSFSFSLVPIFGYFCKCLVNHQCTVWKLNDFLPHIFYVKFILRIVEVQELQFLQC